MREGLAMDVAKREEKTVLDLLEELAEDPELNPDPKARKSIVEKLKLALVES